MPAAVPFEHTSEIVETGGGGVEEITANHTIPGPSNRPEAIVRPLRRREPSDDDHRSPDIENLEAQIINNLNKLEKHEKFVKQGNKEGEKKSKEFYKKSVKDVSKLSDHVCVKFNSKYDTGIVVTSKNQ